MITYLEGLPGAGKTYESMLRHVIPALKAGRAVVTNIDGVNTEELGKLGGELLLLGWHDRDKDERQAIPEYTEHIIKTCKQVKNPLVVLDEVQDFWGVRHAKMLPQSFDTFITKHRHEGIDFVLIGQDYRDTQILLRRRIDKLTTLANLDMLGAAKRYSWTLFSMAGGKPAKVSGGVEVYKAEVFRLYKSVEEGAKTERHTDARASIWNRPLFKFFIPGAVFGALYGIWHVWGMFNAPDKMVNASAAPASAVLASTTVSAVATSPTLHPSAVASASAVVSAPPPAPALPSSYRGGASEAVARMLNTLKARAAAVVYTRTRLAGYVDFLKEDMIVERVTLEGLVFAGFKVARTPLGLEISDAGGTWTIPHSPVFEKAVKDEGKDSRLNHDVKPDIQRAQQSAQPATPPAPAPQPVAPPSLFR